MMTAQRLLPSSVGVAPGTTTAALNGLSPWNYVNCDNSPARVALQKMRDSPPGKYPSSMGPMTRGRWWSPYETIESLRGGIRRGLGRALGIVVTPFEYVAAGKNRNYCTSAPGRGPDYTGAGGTLMGLGAIPTDFDLAKQYGSTPMMHQWIPFNEGTFTTPPFIQPTGNWGPNPKINTGIWAPPLAGPRAIRLGDGDDVDIVEQPNDGTTPSIVPMVPMDAGTAAVLELKRHQDRMFQLGILSAVAVASTALINVFRYNAERRDVRKRSTRVAAEPNPVISGARRRRR